MMLVRQLHCSEKDSPNDVDKDAAAGRDRRTARQRTDAVMFVLGIASTIVSTAQTLGKMRAELAL